MKILVTVKRTPQRDVRVKIDASGAPEVATLPYEVNPFDELAVEEALRIREASGGEIVVVTVGGEECHEQLLAALAMGADRAVRVDPGVDAALDPLQVARALAVITEREQPELVLAGKLSVDDENGQVPAMLAALLDWPQASQASAIEVDTAAGTATVTCEVDDGLEVVAVDLPAVVTADLRLNEPRYASLPGILKAKKKPVDVVPLAECGDVGPARVRSLAFREPPARAPGVVVGSVDELADAIVARLAGGER